MLLGATALLAGLPLVLGPYSVIVLSSGLVLAIACLGLNLLLGFTGLLSLGHAAFFGVGGYAGAFLFTFGEVTAFEAYLAAGVLAAGALAGGLGAVCVRATRIFFTILTLAFAQMVHSLFVSGAVFRPFGEVGKGFFLIGFGGLYIPRLTLAGSEIAPEPFTTVLYYVIALAFLVVAALLRRVTTSPFGLALQAIRDNETRAWAIGIPVRRFRWIAFVLSGLVTGLAGALGGQLDRQVTPQQLHWLFSAELVVATVLGGSRHFVGPAIGAFTLVALREAALRAVLYQRLALGALLIGVVLIAPAGVAGLGETLLHRLRSRRPR
jgi:branched-chain amino acid transport system permease protein